MGLRYGLCVPDGEKLGFWPSLAQMVKKICSAVFMSGWGLGFRV